MRGKIERVSDSSIPPDVYRLVLRHVRSIGELEILLLLGRSPDRSRSSLEVYQIVLSNEELVARTLEKFRQLGLLQQTETGFQFSPASSEISEAMKTLSDLYRERPGRVVQRIYEERAEIEEFAKAFKIRKDK